MANKFNSEYISIIKGSHAAKFNPMYLQSIEDNDKINKKDTNARRTAKINVCVALDDGSLREETAEEVCKRINAEVAAEKHCNSSVITMTLGTLQNLFVRNLIKLNMKKFGKNAVENESQRLEAWNSAEQSRYIFDIIRGKYVDMPSMRTVECPSNRDMLIFYPSEGQQRTISLYKFVDGSLELEGTGTWMDGMRFTDFDIDTQLAFLNIPIRIVVLDERYRNVHMYSDLFFKTNTCGVHLNAVERSEAMKKTYFGDQVRKLVESKEFISIAPMTEAKTSRQTDYAVMTHGMALCVAAEIEGGKPKIANGTQKVYNEAMKRLMETKSKSEIHLIMKEAKQVLEMMQKLNLRPMCLAERKCKKTGALIPANYISNKKFVSMYFMTYVLFNIIGSKKATEVMATADVVIRETILSVMKTQTWESLMSGGTNDMKRSQMLTDAVIAELLAKRPVMRAIDEDNDAFYSNLQDYVVAKGGVIGVQSIC